MFGHSENKHSTTETCRCACCENKASKFLSRGALATRWNIESKTLANWSSAKIGPPVTKIAGRLVRYAMTDIEAFERSFGRVNPTSGEHKSASE